MSTYWELWDIIQREEEEEEEAQHDDGERLRELQGEDVLCKYYRMKFKYEAEVWMKLNILIILIKENKIRIEKCE